MSKQLVDGDSLARLREIAYRDEAKSVTVRADDLRTIIAAFDITIAAALDDQLAERIRLKLPTIRARTGNPMFDAGTHNACEQIAGLLDGNAQ